MYKILDLKNENERKTFHAFLESHPRCNFQQSLEWGEVKTSWIKEVIVSEDEKQNIKRKLNSLDS